MAASVGAERRDPIPTFSLASQNRAILPLTIRLGSPLGQPTFPTHLASAFSHILGDRTASQSSTLFRPSCATLGYTVEDKEEKKRIDFKSGVPDLLYRQAGGRCSVPRCSNPTMGPFYAKDGAVNMGVAAHIYSAAEDGPRGWGGKDEEFISSEANGLWCCQYHSVLIDKNKGRDYPASMLFAWKALAEARVRKQMNDLPSPLGWVSSIEFDEFPKRLELPKIELTRSTLVSARNGAGKSALMQIAASVTDAQHAERFISSSGLVPADGSQKNRFSARLIYTTVDALGKVVKLEIAEGTLIRWDGTQLCLLPPGDLEVIYCAEESRRRLEQEDDMDFFMRVLNLDKSALVALSRMSRGVLMPGEFKFSQADDDSDDEVEEPTAKKVKADGRPYMEITFKKLGHDSFISYSGLSGSEQVRLLLDLFISKAREVSNQRLTLFMAEDLPTSLDEGNFAKLLSALANEPFQSLLSLPPGQEKAVLDPSSGTVGLKEVDHLKGWTLVTPAAAASS